MVYTKVLGVTIEDSCFYKDAVVWIGLVAVALHKDERSCKTFSCKRICWQLKDAIPRIVVCKYILGKGEDNYQRGDEDFSHFVVMMTLTLFVCCPEKKMAVTMKINVINGRREEKKAILRSRTGKK
jgi:hypothetical protein